MKTTWEEQGRSLPKTYGKWSATEGTNILRNNKLSFNQYAVITRLRSRNALHNNMINH